MADRDEILKRLAQLQNEQNNLNTVLSSLVDDSDQTSPDLGPTAHQDDTRPDELSPASLAGPALSQKRLRTEFGERYRQTEPLGMGGMGEVTACRDDRIGRSVAMKVIRPEHQQKRRLRERFLFEARVQGQLEHPSVVPVYDLGVRPDGSEFFTMKRLHGQTLREIIASLRNGERGTSLRFSRRRLLTAFQQVCLAVEFAHRRGVIHRDLKPANIMLGAYGEVSVLDWGLAKLVATHDADDDRNSLVLAERSAEGMTQLGEVLGTPAYMSPEQAAGEDGLDPRSDIFSLGAILFEILTLRTLIDAKSDDEFQRKAARGDYDPRVRQRYPELDLSVELEQTVVRATSQQPTDRFQSARQLYDAMDRYLEGEGDVRQRRSLARKHTRAAISAVAEMKDAEDPLASQNARRKAIDEVRRALAIEETNGVALRTMMTILEATPEHGQPEAAAQTSAISEESRRRMSKRGAVAYGVAALHFLLLALLGPREPLWLSIGAGATVAAGLVAYQGSRQATVKLWQVALMALLAVTGFGMSTTILGPFVLPPLLLALNAAMTAVAIDRNGRWLTVGISSLGVVAPIVLWGLGLIPLGWEFVDGGIFIPAQAVQLSPTLMLVFLVFTSVEAIVLPPLVIGAARDARTQAEHDLALTAQQLAELVPPAAHAASIPPPSFPRTDPPPPSAPRKAPRGPD